MLRNKLVILSAVLLSACASTQPGIKIVTQKIEVPVAVPCKTDIPPTPSFNFDKLTSDKDIYNKTQAVLADRLLHLGYEDQLVTALKSCR